MRKAIAMTLCLLALSSCAYAQEELFSWTLRLGGEGITRPAAMCLAYEGGAFIAGETDSERGDFGESYGLTDGFLLRVDPQGTILWKHRYGGSGNDTFTHVIETADGGCVAMGTSDSQDGDTRSPRGGLDAFLVRVSPEGETLWTKNLGGSLDDELLDILETEDGQFMVCGRTMSYNGDLGSNNGGWDAWVALLSPEDGRQIWVDRHGDLGDDMYTKIIRAFDGWLLIGEYSEIVSTNEEEVHTFEGKPIAIMYSADGQRVWSEPIILGGTGVNRLLDITETDMGWLLVGETNSRSAFMPGAQGGMDIWALFLRHSSAVQRQQRYGGSLNDTPRSVQPIPAGGYIILGTTESSDGNVSGAHGGKDVWVLCVSPTGVLEWQQTLGGGEDDMPAGLVRTASGGYLVAGTTLSQDGDIGRHVSVRTGFLSMLSANGNLMWIRLMGGTEECTLLDLKADQDEAYLLGGIRMYQAGAFVEDLLFARLSETCYPAGE